MLSTGFMGGAYKSVEQPLMPYPCLFGLVFVRDSYRISQRVHLNLAITPLSLTMVQTHLCFRYAWTPARQLPGLAPSSSAF